MTLPASGTISIANIQSEYEMGSEGGYTDRNRLRGLGGIHEVSIAPGNTISLSNFYGKTKPAPVLSSYIIYPVDYGTYLAADVNVVIGPNDYRLRQVWQGKSDKYLRLGITRPTGSSNTCLVRRIKISAITDVSRLDDAYETSWTTGDYSAITRYFGWNYYWSWQLPNLMNGGSAYALDLWADTFN